MKKEDQYDHEMMAKLIKEMVECPHLVGGCASGNHG